MFYDFISYNIQSRDLTPAQKHRAEYLNEVRTDDSPEKEIAPPSRESALILRNLFANASRFARLS